MPAVARIDPKDAKKQAPDNKLTVIDLKASPPKTIATLEAGKGAAGLSVNRKGDMALVANRNEGTVSVFSIKGKTLTKTDTVSVGDEKSNPSHAVISPDGATALVTLDGNSKVAILHIKDGKVTVDKRALAAGVRPYGADIASTGFANYSSGLEQRSGRWTRENLLAFMDDPQAFAPGTTMPDPGVDDARTREELVNMLDEMRRSF